MRPLSLHASALNDEEYEFYTASLRDLNDDTDSGTHDDVYFEGLQIGVREVRGWMRGKYAHLPPGVIDSILRFFAPELTTTDVLSGGQFFAALRLVVHAGQGKDVDRSLGFVQAHPAPLPAAVHSSRNPFASGARVPPLPPRKPAPLQPFARPPKHSSASSTSSALPSPRKSMSPTPLPHQPPYHPPVPPKPSHVTSTLIKQSLQATKAAQTMKRAETQLERERVLQVLKSSSVVSTVSGARVERSSVVVGTSVRTIPHDDRIAATPGAELSPSISSGESAEGRAPPLPRRRNTQQQQQSSSPVSVSSLEQVALARTPSEPIQVPPLDHRISSPTVTSTPPSSIRSSKNPFPVSAIPGANNPYRRPSTSYNKSYTASPQSSPSRGTTDLPPPTHPDRLPSTLSTNAPSYTISPFDTPSTNDLEESPTTRVGRSKSLHHPSPPPLSPLPVAPPRRRPESVQVLGPSTNRDGLTTLSRRSSISNSAFINGTHKRQTSLNATFASGKEREQEKDWENPLGKFARSWQPRLEKARYKAEAGLSRRGFVRTGDLRERSNSKGPEETEDLLTTSPFDGSNGGWQGRGHGYDDYDPPSVDGDADAASDDGHRLNERDGLKWPVEEGEGWRPL